MSGRGISQNVDASESFVDGRNSGLLETIGASYRSCLFSHVATQPGGWSQTVKAHRLPPRF